MNATRSECGRIPAAPSREALRAIRRTIFQASGWPMRLPAFVTKIGPVVRPVEVGVECFVSPEP